jgi:hypothetical protein
VSVVQAAGRDSAADEECSFSSGCAPDLNDMEGCVIASVSCADHFNGRRTPPSGVFPVPAYLYCAKAPTGPRRRTSSICVLRVLRHVGTPSTAQRLLYYRRRR